MAQFNTLEIKTQTRRDRARIVFAIGLVLLTWYWLPRLALGRENAEIDRLNESTWMLVAALALIVATISLIIQVFAVKKLAQGLLFLVLAPTSVGIVGWTVWKLIVSSRPEEVFAWTTLDTILIAGAAIALLVLAREIKPGLITVPIIIGFGLVGAICYQQDIQREAINAGTVVLGTVGRSMSWLGTYVFTPAREAINGMPQTWITPEMVMLIAAVGLFIIAPLVYIAKGDT